MKLQKASKKQIRRMAVGCGLCALLELAGFFLLSQLMDGFHFGYQIFLGTLGGTLVAVANFVILCLTIQTCAGMENGPKLKSRVQLSYNLRLALQAAWVIIAFVAPCFNALAAAIPLLFPTAVIWFLQSRGKLVDPSERPASPSVDHEAAEESEEDSEDSLNSFEV